MTYLRQKVERLAPLSLLDPIEIPDEGLAGANLGQEDNQTTGGFLGHDYQLTDVLVPEYGNLVEAAKEVLGSGQRLLIVDGPAEAILSIADLPEAEEAVHLQCQC